MIRFLSALLLTAACVGVLTWVLGENGVIDTPSFFVETLLILLFGTFMIYRYLSRLTDPHMFTQLYLLSMVVKLLAYGAYNVAVIIMDRAGAPSNVVFFLVLYFIFTALEVAFLYRKISS